MGMAAETLLVREVADQLGVDRVEVYRLIRTGVWTGAPMPPGTCGFVASL